MSVSLFIGDVTRRPSQSAVDTAHWHCVRIMWGILMSWIHQMWSSWVPLKIHQPYNVC